tara:strand:- start:285 stop:536 length:252 start_codon:yes stop_codon:yes gene_type:complete
MTWKNHETIGKVNKVWTKTPQEMLDYILQVDKEMERENNHYSPAFYIGKPLSYIREVYEEYVGLESLTENEQIENGYYRLEIV